MADCKTFDFSVMYYDCFVNAANSYRRFIRARWSGKTKSAKNYALKTHSYLKMGDGIEKVCSFADLYLGHLQHMAYLKNTELLPLRGSDRWLENSGYAVFCNVRKEINAFLLDEEVVEL